MDPEDKEDVVLIDEDTTEDYSDDNESENDAGNTEDEAKEKPESGDKRRTETPEARRARIKRQYEREFGKEKRKEGGKEDSKKDSKEEVDERYSRLELKTEGVTSKKAQDIVLEYAKFKGIEVTEALQSTIVRAEIAELEKKKSVPAPSKRTSPGASDSFEYWVGQAKKGHFPVGDREMMRKLQQARIFTK